MVAGLKQAVKQLKASFTACLSVAEVSGTRIVNGSTESLVCDGELETD
jgi:hypothetical protein